MRSGRIAIVLVIVGTLLSGCSELQNASVPLCPGPNRNAAALILMAQSIPSAAYIPCIGTAITRTLSKSHRRRASL